MAGRDVFEAGRRLLAMVAELHARGLERLRIAPHMSPSGAYWRCDFAPTVAIRRDHGARAVATTFDIPRYSSSSGFHFFDWGDCTDLTPSQLADRFERFEQVVELARGSDPDYVAWYREMLSLTEPLGLPIAFADYDTPPDALLVHGECAVRVVRLPPPRPD